MLLDKAHTDKMIKIATSYGVNYSKAYKRYLAMLEANFEQDIEDIIDEIESEEVDGATT